MHFSCCSSSSVGRFSPGLKLVCGVKGYSLENSCTNNFQTPALGRVCVGFSVTDVFVVCNGPSLGPRADRGFSLSTRCVGNHCGLAIANFCGMISGHVAAT